MNMTLIETAKKAAKNWKNIDGYSQAAELIQLLCDELEKPATNWTPCAATREIIKLLKAAGNHVQILTKGGRAAERDFDLLDENDRFGITYAGYSEEDERGIAKEEPNAASPRDRIVSLMNARKRGIKTWVSFEPVLNTEDVLVQLQNIPTDVDVKIGKLNYHKTDNKWGAFGSRAEQICKWRGLNYYIKDSLRAEMEKHHAE